MLAKITSFWEEGNNICEIIPFIPLCFDTVRLTGRPSGPHKSLYGKLA